MARPQHEDTPLYEPSTLTREFSAPFVIRRISAFGQWIHPAEFMNTLTAYASFRVPWDWAGFLSIALVLWPIVTANHTITIVYVASKSGELYNTHTQTTVNVHAVIINQTYEIDALADAAAFWAAVTPGDNVMVSVSCPEATGVRAETVCVRYI